ncbi:MAG: 2-succinyl-5-enolpyruvyl-6-hydroxy-3-cyclohexene-1-carboxylic-acid synthase [Candidatus Limnocylindrales bacterium]|jgi:2-succinyl-5-enolpyruvyl-6-hydroxy-3-cyclohexene-1-carboxylate synthase
MNGMPPGANLNTVDPLRAFVEELARAGVAEVVICPGSRSTPLALALHAHPELRCRVLLDERAAGFFALGMARASRRPVAVLCTSGTAAVNLTPAVVEAFHGRIPLVLLTADRPPELRDRGAAQTIDQVRLYGTQVKWFVDVPVLDAAPDLLAHVRSLAGRAVATSLAAPRGPVHLNFQLREPLIPDGPLGPLADDPHDRAVLAGPGVPFIDAIAGSATLSPAELRNLAATLATIERGLIVAGPQEDPAFPAAAARLAATTGYPILADPLSQVRVGPHDRSHVIARGDLITRPGSWIEAHRPEMVIRFGAMPTSKPILEMLRLVRPALLVVDGGGGWRESALLPATFIHADEVAVADGLADVLARTGTTTAAESASSWTADWLAADRTASDALAAWLDRPAVAAEPLEPRPFTLLADLMPDGGVLWAGSSMPVRDMDAYLASGPRAIRCHSNRGANGIDGVVSSALGAAAAETGAVVLVVGDLSFLHDLTALVTARLNGLSATIVLVNNDGGGIFSFLPQASTVNPGVGLPEAYEELFGTPHGVDFGPVVRALGAEHALVGAGDLRAALAESIGAAGVRVLEIRTDRAKNVVLHREAAAAVAAGLDALQGGESRP